ncbi:LppU/SCO3897 family protein [Saccharopolyspora kobensis]|uniref:LppU/SCO3897 family protein n=1 Tax=Saccharopolyspora kobensis TaxID=146035 RepID=UPI00116106D6|nr:hypothetical protein [Saccharopolyspora kobensis]
MTQPPQFGQHPQQQPQWGRPPQQQWGQPQQPVPPQGYPQQPPVPAPGYPQQQQIPPQGYPGGPPPQGYPGGPAPQKSGVGKKILGVVGTLGLGIVGVVVLALLRSVDGGGIAVGECVDITSPSMARADWETAACGTSKSDFKVAKQLDGRASCGDDYDSAERPGDYVLCLVPDVAVGDCRTDSPTELQVKVPCTDPDAKHRITAVADNASGPPECAEGDPDQYYMVWNEPALTICWKSA